jgi:DNA-directed RNA polymerase specialized sigma subunit
LITIEDLKKLRYYDAAIQAAEERKADLMQKASGLTRSLSGMPHAAAHVDKMAEYMVKLERVEADLSRQLLEMVELENRVRAEIEQLPDQQATIMHYRYLAVNWRKGRRLTWHEVAKKTHYAESHCRMIHSAALKRLCGVKAT